VRRRVAGAAARAVVRARVLKDMLGWCGASVLCWVMRWSGEEGQAVRDRGEASAMTSLDLSMRAPGWLERVLEYAWIFARVERSYRSACESSERAKCLRPDEGEPASRAPVRLWTARRALQTFRRNHKGLSSSSWSERRVAAPPPTVVALSSHSSRAPHQLGLRSIRPKTRSDGQQGAWSRRQGLEARPLTLSASQLSPSSSSPLLNLPLELLDAIFGQVYTPDKRAYKPLCKQLHPLQHRHYWRRLLFSTYEELAGFCRRAPSIPGLEASVVELELFMLDEWNWENERLWFEHQIRLEEGDDVGDDAEQVGQDFECCPTALFVDSVLNRLAALRHLKLYQVDESYVQAIFGDDEATCAARPWLERLERLHVDLRLDGTLLGNGPMQSWLGKLGRVPRLRVLRIAQDEVPFEPPPTRAPEPVPSLPALESLALSAGNFYSWTGAPLALVAPNLVRLELDRAHPDDQVVAVLGGAPEHLRELIVTPNVPTSFPRLDLVLPRFVHLRRLQLSQNALDPIRIIPSLRSLPNLEVLAFNHYAPVTDTLLAAILDGPERLGRLRHLTLAHIFAFPGYSLERRQYKIPSDLEALSFQLPQSWDWYRPKLPPGATKNGLRDAVCSASEHGIVIDGSVHAVLSWDEQYRVARQAVILAWASRAKGRWDVARGLVGDTAVEAYRQGLAAARTLERGLGE